MGRAFPLCPSDSDVDLFRYRERVVDFDPGSGIEMLCCGAFPST